MMHWGSYGWGMGFGWIYMIVFWVLIITAIVYFVKSLSNKSGSEVRHGTPLDTLKRRYAKGEITREEFERMKDDLKKS
jgi:putative membrane protein